MAFHEDAVSVCTALRVTKIKGDPLYIFSLDLRKDRTIAA